MIADAHASSEPARWIVRFAPLIAADARVLDLASGHGRHARFLAARGAQVLAVDRDAEALASLAGVEGVQTRTLDLEAGEWPLRGETFDAIVVVNYLHRPHLDAMLGALAADGVLLYQTFAVGNEAFGRPSNPAFLLRPGELLQAVAGRLVPLAFEQGIVTEHGRQVVVQRLAAIGRARRWPVALPD